MSPARPSLLPVAAFVSLLVLLLGATGLFALHHTNQKTAEDLARLDAAEDALVLTVRARAAFKTQVQEWKNVLLRGRDLQDLATYRDRFERHEAEVRRDLEILASRESALELSPFSEALEEHTRLGEAYRVALSSFDPANPLATDAAVRGIDRALDEKLDALAATMEASTTAELKSAFARAAARYEVLRRITWIVASFAVFASLWLCFRATRLAP